MNKTLKLNYNLQKVMIPQSIITRNVELKTEDCQEIKIDKCVLKTFGWNKEAGKTYYQLKDLKFFPDGKILFGLDYVKTEDGSFRYFKFISELQLFYFAFYGENMKQVNDFEFDEL